MELNTSPQIRIESDDDMTDLEKSHRLLRTLILTPEGTMVGNRDFGISFDLVGMPPNQAVNYLAMELQKKLPLFIPEIEVSEIEWSADALGRASFIIHIREAES